MTKVRKESPALEFDSKLDENLDMKQAEKSLLERKVHLQAALLEILHLSDEADFIEQNGGPISGLIESNLGSSDQELFDMLLALAGKAELVGKLSFQKVLAQVRDREVH